MDLISREALQNEFAHKCRGVCDICQYDMYGLCNLIKDAPTVEAVPVVHCKDCKHWGTGVAGETEHVKCCEYGKYMVGENGYCVYGEKV